MTHLHAILREITALTTEMSTAYPELYRYLDENPLTLTISQNPQIDEQVMEDYLQSLKELVRHHQASQASVLK